MSGTDRERPSASIKSAPEKKRRSILDRMNLGPFKPEQKAAKAKSRFVDRARPIPNEPGKEPARQPSAESKNERKNERENGKQERDERSALWDQFETAYIESGKNLKKLAEEFGVGYSTARRRAREGSWTEKSATFQSKLRQQRLAQALLTKVEVFGIQQSAALETGAIFQAIFEDRARKLRENPSAKGAVSDLAKLIDLQLDIEELVLTILGDLELHARAAKLGGGEPPIH